jgi:hypothetical protein
MRRRLLILTVAAVCLPATPAAAAKPARCGTLAGRNLLPGTRIKVVRRGTSYVGCALPRGVFEFDSRGRSATAVADYTATATGMLSSTVTITAYVANGAAFTLATSSTAANSVSLIDGTVEFQDAGVTRTARFIG